MAKNVMKGAFTLLIIIMLCVPSVSAVWYNGKSMTEDQYAKFTDGYTVVENKGSGVTSLYRATNSGVTDPSSYGYAIFMVRAGGSSQDLNVWVSNKLQNLTFDSRFNPDKSAIEGQNPGWDKYVIYKSGESDLYQFAAGNFTACIQKSNGDQSECHDFTVGGADTYRATRVAFLGSAISTNSPTVCVPDYTITSATYGLDHCNDVIIHHGNYSFVQHHEAIEGVRGSEAWTEHFGNYRKNHGSSYTYVGSKNGDFTRSGSGIVDPYMYSYVAPTHHNAVHGSPESYSIVSGNTFTGMCKETYGTYDFKIGNKKYRAGSGNGYDKKYLFTPSTPDTAAYDTHNGNYDASHNYVGDGNGDYTRSGSGVNDPYVYSYIAPQYHPAVHEVHAKPAWDEYGYVGTGNGDYIGYCDVIYEVFSFGDKPPHNVCKLVYTFVPTTTECKSDGSVIDVKQNMQEAVDSGVTMFFLFNNSKNPGGIFDEFTNALLSPIEDPAYGYVKDVSIEYNDGCGVTKSIQTKEYYVIDLVSGTATSPESA